MKNITIVIGIICFVFSLIYVFILNRSAGTKYGTLQKISCKQFPCTYYVIEVAYEGGRVIKRSESAAFQNAQEFQITKQAFDTLHPYVGKKILFDYNDRGVVFCGIKRFVTNITIDK